MNRRLAIVRYKLAARRYRRRETDYGAMTEARGVMLAACGYDREYSYIGEFCNLHERDFPSYISARLRPETYDRNAIAEGRIYRYSGWHTPVDRATHEATCTASRRRALVLQRTLELDPVDRFIHGWSVVYCSTADVYQMAAWSRRRQALTVFDCAGFDVRESATRIATEGEAKAFFVGLVEPKFQELPQHVLAA